jgi:hypothetical protein
MYLAGALLIAALANQQWNIEVYELVIALMLTGGSCILSLRGISSRVGPNHRIIRVAVKVPGGRLACGL